MRCFLPRKLIEKIFLNSNCLIFVFDSNGRERVDEAKNKLHRMLLDNEISDTFLLIFANKQVIKNIKS